MTTETTLPTAEHVMNLLRGVVDPELGVAVAAGDAQARQQLQDWLRSTGYRDAVTENILGGASRG